MQLPLALGLLSGVLDVASVIRYLYEIVRGTTRPNAVSYALWTLIGVVEGSAQFAAGASWSLIIIMVLTVNMSIITLLALSGYGYRKHGWIDYACLVFAVFAIIAWQVTGDPVQALWWALAANVISAIPTFIKASRAPETEDAPAWVLYAAAAVCAVLSTEKIDVANLLIPGYLVFESVFTLMLLSVPRRQAHR